MKLLSATSEHDITTWPSNNWNIPEPPVNDASRSDALNDANISLDLIIMPGVAFDSKCARLGQGMVRFLFDDFELLFVVSEDQDRSYAFVLRSCSRSFQTGILRQTNLRIPQNIC
mmetsp:Transcript_11467/g.19652  ORF Transcript_11467/g.19652 Transcript_11467/m.19652 type:complete len:115 (+) Transcript_11467:453-797(+)